MTDYHRAHSTKRQATFMRAGVLAAFVLLVSVGCETVDPAPLPAARIPPPYRIGAPDILLVSVLPEPILEREVVVRPDGFITIDLVGDVKATGRTASEISADVQQRMTRFKRDALVSISVKAALSDAISVFGEVLAPGTFPLEREMRLAEAIGARGGTSKFAAKSRVRVIRMQEGSPLVIQSDFGRIEQGNVSTNVTLQKGDIVVVPPSLFSGGGLQDQRPALPLLADSLGDGGSRSGVALLAVYA